MGDERVGYGSLIAWPLSIVEDVFFGSLGKLLHYSGAHVKVIVHALAISAKPESVRRITTIRRSDGREGGEIPATSPCPGR